MGIRDGINRHPKTVLVAATALIILMTGAAAFRLIGGSSPKQSPYGSNSWYTVDDGRSWFEDEAGKLVPFQHDGKPAYRCYVWSCDGGKIKFVSHLERVKADTLALLTRAGKTKVDFLEMPPGSQQVKPPGTGDSEWRDATDPRAVQITTPRCPGGATEGTTPQPVIPQ